MNKSKKRWMIVVNIITLLRVIGSIILFSIYFNFGSITVGLILTGLFLTDWIDGFLARRFKVSTFFGSIMDSISDKLMAIVSCIILCFINKYMIASIIIEILIIFVNTFALTQKANIKSSYIGKIKTWVLSIAIIAGFFICKENTNIINLFVALPAIIFELITLIDYFKKCIKVKIVIENKKPKYKEFKEIKKMLFSPEFYEKNKNKTGLIDNIYINE